MFMQNLIELKKSGQFEQESRLKLEPHSLTPTVQWSLATRILFRFCFAYFILFLLSNWIGPLFVIPKLAIPRLGILWLLRQINRIALILQATFGLYLVLMQLHGGIEVWYTRGGGRPKPSIYGIWDVEQMTIDGQIRSPSSPITTAGAACF